MTNQCNSLDEVRQQIDLIDKEIIKLMSQRNLFVSKASQFKESVDDIIAAERVDSVISKVKTLSEESGLNPSVTEKVYRTMIRAFTEEELSAYNSQYRIIKESYY